MVSPELLRRYPFFGFLSGPELNAVAMIAEEMNFQTGEVVIEADEPANYLFLLVEGGLDLTYAVVDKEMTGRRKEFYIGEINPGEITGISALIEPYKYTMIVRATKPSRVVRLEGAALRALCEIDARLAYDLMRETAQAAMARLHDTRIQLAAARA